MACCVSRTFFPAFLHSGPRPGLVCGAQTQKRLLAPRGMTRKRHFAVFRTIPTTQTHPISALVGQTDTNRYGQMEGRRNGWTAIAARCTHRDAETQRRRDAETQRHEQNNKFAAHDGKQPGCSTLVRRPSSTSRFDLSFPVSVSV